MPQDHSPPVRQLSEGQGTDRWIQTRGPDRSSPGHRHQRKAIQAPHCSQGSRCCGGCVLVPMSPPHSSSSLSSAKSVIEVTLQGGTWGQH